MTQRVVDLLELIEVDKEQRRLRRLAGRRSEQFLDLVAEADAVRQARQFIDPRHMADLRFGIAAFGDVFDENDGTRPPSIGLERPAKSAFRAIGRIKRRNLRRLRAFNPGDDLRGVVLGQRAGADAGPHHIANVRLLAHEIG